MSKIIFKNLLCICALFTTFTSCMKEELPVPLKPKGSEIVASVALNEDYRMQVFYSLKNNTVVGANLYTAWDLGFEATAEGWHVILNGAKFRMAVYPISKSFEAVKVSDTIGVPSLIDASSGSLDSTAIGDWRSGNRTYIVHRGTDEVGKFLGMAKIQILSVNAQKYVVQIANIDGTNEKTIELMKDQKYNYTFLSFDEGGKSLFVEPPKRDWDIVFTKYTHYYHDLNTRYSVVGCLLNSYRTVASKDTNKTAFTEIDLRTAASIKFNSALDAIGFEWKTYDIDKGKFSIDASKHYIIRSGEEEIYYKLRFIDFYENGLKGNPQFEYQRL